jgi:transposase-like protein
MAILDAGFDNATVVLTLLEPYRRRLRTTNSLERLNEEIRRREWVAKMGKAATAWAIGCAVQS